MSSNSSCNCEEPTSNLNHIYFFVKQGSDIHNDTHSATSTTNDSTETRSSASSPGSHGTDSTTMTSFASSNSEMNPLAQTFTPKKSTNLTQPPKPTASNLFGLRETADKGLGLYATTFIELGTQIIREEPLLRISQNAIHHVWGPYCRLSNAEKAAYDSLHAFTPANPDLEYAARTYLIDRNDEGLEEDDVAELIAEQVRVMSLFAPNNFKVSPSGLAVYATASRLNHSCVPNVHHSYNPTLQRITGHAIRDIYPDEELLTTYLGGPSTYQPATQRNADLVARYGFTCKCPACSDTTGGSDGRRELMAGVAWGLQQFTQGATFPNPFIPVSPAAALKQAENLVGIMLSEGITSIELTKAYRVASTQALKLGDFDLAFTYARDEAEVEKNCLGTVLNDLKKIGVATECWVKSIWEVMEQEKGKEAVLEYKDGLKRERKKAKQVMRRNKKLEGMSGKMGAANDTGSGRLVNGW